LSTSELHLDVKIDYQEMQHAYFAASTAVRWNLKKPVTPVQLLSTLSPQLASTYKETGQRTPSWSVTLQGQGLILLACVSLLKEIYCQPTAPEIITSRQ